METFVLKTKNLNCSIYMLRMSRLFGNSGSRDTFQFLTKMGNYLLNVSFKLLYFPLLFLPGAMLLQGTETYWPAEKFDLFNRYFLSLLIEDLFSLSTKELLV